MAALMSIGLRAMTANYAALQTTGHNIANASVDGYSRQDTLFATSTGQFTGAGFFGKGVDVVGVRRAHDDFLAAQANVARSLSEMDSTRAGQLGELEKVFPTGEAGVGYAIGEFLNALGDVANNPSDLSARQVVLARAEDVALRFGNAGTQLQTLQAGVTQDIGNSVASANNLMQQIADLNQQIAKFTGLGQTPNDLLDARDRAVNDLSGYLTVTTIAADDGTIGVFAAGGQRLVLGNDVQPLRAVRDPADPSRSAIALDDNGVLRTLDNDIFTGGSIAGLLRFQNEDLVDARNLLGQMAAALNEQVNLAQANGLDLRTPAGAGAPIFSIGTPVAQPAATNARNADGSFVSSVSIAIVDATQTQPSDYELRPAPDGTPGMYQLTRLSDGQVSQVASGDIVDGVRIDIGTPAPAAGDRFLLQPVGSAAVSMKMVLDDPRGLAAASPVSATMGVANTGTATVDTLTLTDGSVDPELTASITFTSDTGDYTWELRDRTSGALVSSGTDAWTAGEPIELNGFALALNGVPDNGDTVTVAKTTQPETNNGNALAMLSLRDRTIVGQTATFGGSTLTDAYASAMSDIGVRAQSANMTTQMSTAARTQAESALAARTGVNLDEEAAHLIQYQQAYQAAAKVLQAAQAIFQTMLDVGGT